MAFVLDALVGTVVKKLVDKAIKDVVTALGVETKMKTLKRNMERISNVLVDAESKKIEEKSIYLWLAQLREVMYNVEDLLDDFHAYADKDAMIKSKKQKLKDKIGPMFSINFSSKIGTRIEEINSTLERLTSQTSTLQLLASRPNADKKVCRYNSSRITDTCSIQLDSDIVGLDDDATGLANRIIKDNNRAHSVFAITGMGGIGKTTLAQKVFNHVLIKNHFKNDTVWVCVSSNCSGEYLLKEIVRSIDNNYNQIGVSINEISSKVIEVVKGKRVFIVLDDIWDADFWEIFLRVPLLTGAEYSRILITTRNQEVAKKMKVVHTHPMTNMKTSDGWSMLCEIVFKEEEGKDDRNKLEDVGKKIVEKCKHLPLAIKVLGGVLKTTDGTIAAWTKVLSSRTWSTCGLPEDILPSLLLSYEDLPSHLKQCFIYCSLFPQDYIFYRVKLQYMWIAEGFIKKEEGARMEEFAEAHYNEMLMRNLLQVIPDHNNGSACKMHDSLRSLALFVSQNQYIYSDPKTFHSSGLIRHRHLWFSEENMNVVPEEIIGQEYVRTLMLSKNIEIKTIPPTLLSGLRRLRVLDLEDIGIKTLPNSVGGLKQLRFLNISSTEFIELPDSIKNLKNLETLIVSILTSQLLPKEIVELYNLRHLLVSDTLRSMPNGLDNLKNLRVLDCFVVNDYRANMKELKDLSQLTDLSIYHLERVASKEEAEEAAMENKTSLKCLKLHCKPPQKLPVRAVKKIEEVFAGIKIPQNLTELSIDGFFGKEFPAHMIGSQLKSLKLEGCKSLENVPSLGDMPKLETLHIKKASSVTKLDSQFFGKLKFPKLRYLHLVEMTKLERISEVNKGAFPCLEKLSILYCLQLKSVSKELMHHATCLKTLIVSDVSSLESIKLQISRKSNLRSVKNLPSLEKMDIDNELSSQSVVSVDMETLPVWLKNSIAPEKLAVTVKGSDKLVQGSDKLVLTNEDQTFLNGCIDAKINNGKIESNFSGSCGASSSSAPMNLD